MLENIFNGRANLRSISIDDPKLLTLLKSAACHHFEQHALVACRVIEDFCADRVGLAEVGEELQILVYARPFHGEQGTTITKKEIAPGRNRERIGIAEIAETN